jgi:enoyl-CoA hydratase
MIAAVDGAALAGGCEICLACDLIVASTKSRFGVPEVKRSLIPAAGGLFRLPQKITAPYCYGINFNWRSNSSRESI